MQVFHSQAALSSPGMTVCPASTRRDPWPSPAMASADPTEKYTIYFHSAPHHLHASRTPPKSHVNQAKQADHHGLSGKWVLLIRHPLSLVQHHCPSLPPHELGQALNMSKKTDPITENKTMQVREGAAQHLPRAEPSLLTFRCCCTAPNFSPLLPKGLTIFCNQAVTFKNK